MYENTSHNGIMSHDPLELFSSTIYTQSGLEKKNLNSILPFGQAELSNFACPE